MRIAICEDEPYMVEDLRGRLQRYASERGCFLQVSEFQEGEALLAEDEEFQIVLMDWKLPQSNGIQVVQQLRKRGNQSQVIFITAYPEHALQAFEVDAAHYLLKPVSDKMLYPALDRAIKRTEQKKQSDSQTIVVACGAETRVIALRDILYCEVMDHRVYIHTRTVTCDYIGTLRELQAQLDDRFFRCHKSYLVNLEQVIARRGETASVFGGKTVLISRRKQREFSQRLLSWVRRELRP